MIDWIKCWIRDLVKIAQILDNDEIEWEAKHRFHTGEPIEYPIKGHWNEWNFEIKTPTWMEITGSLHTINKGLIYLKGFLFFK